MASSHNYGDPCLHAELPWSPGEKERQTGRKTDGPPGKQASNPTNQLTNKLTTWPQLTSYLANEPAKRKTDKQTNTEYPIWLVTGQYKPTSLMDPLEVIGWKLWVSLTRNGRWPGFPNCPGTAKDTKVVLRHRDVKHVFPHVRLQGPRTIAGNSTADGPLAGLKPSIQGARPP